MSKSLVHTALCFVLALCTACGESGGGSSASCKWTPRSTEISGSDENSELDLMSDETDRWIVGATGESVSSLGDGPQEFSIQGMPVTVERLTDQAFTVDLSAAADRTAVLNHISETYDVDFVEPDYRMEIEDTEDLTVDVKNTVDPGIYTKQWGLRNIGAFDAWDYSKGSSSVVVAVIDSGIDFTHPDLKGSAWVNPIERSNGRDDDGNGYVDDINGWNFVSNNAKPSPTTTIRADYHGTHVAGIIAGRQNAAKGVAGVAPNVKLMALRFLDATKGGYTSNSIKAVRYATDKGAKIINGSFGSYNRSQAMANELARAESKGVLFIAAAGNVGQNNDVRPFYPASYSNGNIVSVTASTSSNNWLSGINYGVKSVDLAAPGSSILSTDVSHGYITRTGSSMAAPFAAGVAALMLSANPSLKGPQLKALLLGQAATFNNLLSRVQGGKRLDAKASTRSAASSNKGGVPVVPSLPTDTCS